MRLFSSYLIGSNKWEALLYTICMLIYSSWVIQFKCIFSYYCTRFDKQCFVEICLHQEKLWITELNSGAFQFDLHFPAKELLEFAVHFHPTHPAIFLTFSLHSWAEPKFFWSFESWQKRILLELQKPEGEWKKNHFASMQIRCFSGFSH